MASGRELPGIGIGCGQAVKARSYFVVGGEAQLVSEGIWFWHRKEKQVKGVFTAKEMPVVFFAWTLFLKTRDGLQEVMGGTYERR